MKKISLVILVLAGILVGCTHTEKTATGGAIAGAAVGAMLGKRYCCRSCYWWSTWSWCWRINKK